MFVWCCAGTLFFRKPDYNIILIVFRDLTQCSMGMNASAPLMCGAGFEARKAEVRRKRESERQGETEMYNHCLL